MPENILSQSGEEADPTKWGANLSPPMRTGNSEFGAALEADTVLSGEYGPPGAPDFRNPG